MNNRSEADKNNSRSLVLRSHVLSSTKTYRCDHQMKFIIANLPEKLNHRLSNEAGIAVLTSAYRLGLGKTCWKYLWNMAKMTVGLKSSGDKNNRGMLESRIQHVVLQSSEFDDV
jgi:hypothetical protein